MTDTDAAELNARTARAMGWKLVTDPEGVNEEYWTGPYGGVNVALPYGMDTTGTEYEGKWYGDFYTLPDFARVPHAMSYLLEWLEQLKKARRTHHPLYALQWAVEQRQHGCRALLEVEPRFCSGQGESPSEALCRAICAYADAQKTGK